MNIFAYTPTTTQPNETVPYLSINRQDDGRVVLVTRSRGPAGHCSACDSQEPHSAQIELPEAELDRLAIALLTRRLRAQVEDIDRRTVPLVRFGDAGQRVPMSLSLSAGGPVRAGGYGPVYVVGEEVVQRQGTRVVDRVTGYDLGSAD